MEYATVKADCQRAEPEACTGSLLGADLPVPFIPSIVRGKRTPAFWFQTAKILQCTAVTTMSHKTSTSI